MGGCGKHGARASTCYANGLQENRRARGRSGWWPRQILSFFCLSANSFNASCLCRGSLSVSGGQRARRKCRRRWRGGRFVAGWPVAGGASSLLLPSPLPFPAPSPLLAFLSPLSPLGGKNRGRREDEDQMPRQERGRKRKKKQELQWLLWRRLSDLFRSWSVYS